MTIFIIVVCCLAIILIACRFGLKLMLSAFESMLADNEDVPSMKELKTKIRRMNGEKSLYGIWLQLVEEHWDNIRDSQGNSDYTFRYKRRIHDAFDKDYVNKEVRALALNYWKRNRFRMREAFVNWCYFMSKKASQYEIMKSADGTNMIPCFDDPVVNGRQSRYDVDIVWIDMHMPAYFQRRKIEWLKDNNLI